MPKSSPQKLADQKARNARPEEIKKRVLNNAARRAAIKEGIVKVGDKRDIGHKKPLENGGTNDPKNLEVQSRKENRGWRKGKTGADTYNPDPKKK